MNVVLLLYIMHNVAVCFGSVSFRIPPSLRLFNTERTPFCSAHRVASYSRCLRLQILSLPSLLSHILFAAFLEVFLAKVSSCGPSLKFDVLIGHVTQILSSKIFISPLYWHTDSLAVF